MPCYSLNAGLTRLSARKFTPVKRRGNPYFWFLFPIPMEHLYPKPNQDRAKLASTFMYVALAQVCIATLFNIGFYYAISQGDDNLRNILNIANGLFSLIAFIGSILTIIFFIQWFRRAYYNLHAMGCRNLEHTEGWAAGAWFVPIMNWFWPYQIMREIWNETQILGRQPNDGHEQRSDAPVGWWWTCWILNTVVSIIAVFSSFGKRPGEISEHFYLMNIVANLFSICAGVFAIQIIRTVRVWEDELYQRYTNYTALLYQQQYHQKMENERLNPQHPETPDREIRQD